MEGEVLTEVPINLRKLVQMVVRGFYTVEDMLIVDMLCRNLCLSEDNICDLLKFDRKMLRQRINTLKSDKLLQMKVKMMPTEDGKQQREQFYFINYKSFVNVVKYKLDHIRKKLEMEERDQTSRASFICNNCQRSYTDLEADQLLDIMTGQLVCIICRTEVQEDMSGAPKHDSRMQLTRFNEQVEPLFNLLREVENIKLSAEFSDPNPTDNNLKKNGSNKSNKGNDSSRMWSGEASKRQGFAVEGSVDVNISTDQNMEETQKAKEQPVWLSQAASFITTKITDEPKEDKVLETPKITGFSNGSSGKSHPDTTTSKPKDKHKEKPVDDVMMLLQTHESKVTTNNKRDNDSDSDSVEEVPSGRRGNNMPVTFNDNSLQGIMDSDDDDMRDDNVPLISVGNDRVAITSVDNSVIARMTQQEKNLYINAYQEYMAGMED